MIKASLLRISAQKYATGKISKGDYLRYRRELCNAIESGDPLPETPAQWLSLSERPINPELQTLMTRLHELDEKEYRNHGMQQWQKVMIVVLALLLAALLSWWLLKPVASSGKTVAGSNPAHKINMPFLQSSRKLIPQQAWNNLEVLKLIDQWNQLSKMEQTAIKHHIIVQQLRQQALQHINTADPVLKDSIQLLLNEIR